MDIYLDWDAQIFKASFGNRYKRSFICTERGCSQESLDYLLEQINSKSYSAFYYLEEGDTLIVNIEIHKEVKVIK